MGSQSISGLSSCLVYALVQSSDESDTLFISRIINLLTFFKSQVRDFYSGSARILGEDPNGTKDVRKYLEAF